MLPDCHMHTSFSGDCEISPEIMVEAAIAKGLETIAITDHLDYDYPGDPKLFLLDLDKYSEKVKALQDIYSDKIEILFGIELGLMPHLADTHHALLEKYDFDYVIGSSHVVHGFDPYYPTYFEKRTAEEAYREYFESILENMDCFDEYDSYGHLDYVIRYGPGVAVGYDSYAAFPELIDEILTRLVKKNKALEVNAGGYRHGLDSPNPCAGIIKRFTELGGQYITVGADAHTPENTALEYDRVASLLRSCNVENVTVFKGRKPVLISY